MKIHLQLLGCGALIAATFGSHAAGLNVSANMLCAVTHAVACDTAGECVHGSAGDFNLPVFIKFDPANKLVISAQATEERRTSKIAHSNVTETGIVLAGFEERGGWNAVVQQATGNMTVSTAEQGVGYLVFGSCLNP